jgi:NADPH2:quinone reductase
MRKTKALVCESIEEDLSGVILKEIQLPELSQEEILIKVKAASVNFPDLLMTQGKYQHRPDLPFVLGMEGAGIVVEKGSRVTRFNIGDEVTFGSWGNGAFSNYALVSENGAQLKSKSLNFEEAASFQTAYLTAYLSLVRRGELQSGESLLVHGATGGVGMAAVQLGKKMGAKVIATGTSEKKLKKTIDWGASHYVLTHKKDGVSFREEVKELTDGKGADVIYDPVGGDVFDESIRCINWGGRILIVGFTSGRIPTAPVNMPLIKGFSIVGVRAGEFGRRDPVKGKENIEAVKKLADEGDLKPHVCKTFKLEEAKEAIQFLSERKVVGKVAVVME